MKSLLKELYYGSYERRFVRTPEYNAAAEAMSKVWDAAEAKLGQETREALWNTAFDLADLEGYQDFRDGFRLGVSLMLEVFPQAVEK